MTTSPGPATEGLLLDQAFEERDLHTLRHTVAAHASKVVPDPERVDDLVLIVSELASNAIRHGGGKGRLRLWTEDDAIHCEVSDGGPGISRVTRDRPAPNASGGRGLWLVLNYADGLTVAPGNDGGAVITVTLAV